MGNKLYAIKFECYEDVYRQGAWGKDKEEAEERFNKHYYGGDCEILETTELLPKEKREVNGGLRMISSLAKSAGDKWHVKGVQ